MKITKSLVATMALLAMGATANATETIYITGSTAFRAATLNAVKSLLNNANPTAQSNAAFTSSTAVNWMGVTYNGHTINVKISLYGSVGGVQTVSESIAWPFLIDSATSAQAQGEAFVAGSTTMTYYHDFQVPTIAMSDTLQSSTPFNTTALNDGVVGVVPFQWVASYGASTSLNNVPTGLSMNNHLVNAIFSGGSAPLAQITGNSGDAAKSLFAIGRDADSGTRLIAMAEAGYGATSTVAQFKPVTDTTAVLSHDYYPGATINGIAYDPGNTGYNSGGTLAGMMRYETLTHLAGYYVTYLSKGDATAAVQSGSTGTGNAVGLAWNGVNYYTGNTGTAGAAVFNTAAITSGQYTFWSYEHVLYPNQGSTTQAFVFAPALVTAIKGTTSITGTASASGLNYFTMSVVRSGDGSYVTY